MRRCVVYIKLGTRYTQENTAWAQANAPRANLGKGMSNKLFRITLHS